MSARIEVLGQDTALVKLRKMKAKLPQSLLLFGPSGVGKKKSVYFLYQLVHCTNLNQSVPSLFESAPAVKPEIENPCGECTNCIQISNFRHPDIIELKASGEVIAVDDLREMKRSLNFPPIQGQYRFVLLDEAQKLSTASANALLKILEEPPAHTHFFLMYPDLSLALPTIQSRCQKIAFSPLDDETMLSIFERNLVQINPKILHLCLKLLGGGLERLEKISAEKTQQFLLEAVDFLNRNPRTEQLLAFTESLCSTDRADEFEFFLDLVFIRNHDLALKHTRLYESHVSRNERYLAERFSRSTLEIATLRQQLERHSNKKLTALVLSNKIFEANQTYRMIAEQ